MERRATSPQYRVAGSNQPQAAHHAHCQCQECSVASPAPVGLPANWRSS